MLATAATARWIAVLNEAGVPCGPVNGYDQLFNDPQVLHRQMVVYASDEELGDVPHIRTPVRMPSGVAVRNTAPKLGQHNEEVLGGLGYSRAEIDELHDKQVI